MPTTHANYLPTPSLPMPTLPIIPPSSLSITKIQNKQNKGNTLFYICLSNNKIMFCVSTENMIVILLIVFILVYIMNEHTNEKNEDNPILTDIRDTNSNEEGPVRVHIRSRGPRTEYLQIGVLSQKRSDNNENTILPLYGREIWKGASKCNYFTKTDSHTRIMLPVYSNGRDCTDEYGCDELFDNDSVTVPQYNLPFKVEIYNIDKPRYIPYL